jgi:hypothetical protein
MEPSMKKIGKKLAVKRETLAKLDSSALKNAVGGGVSLVLNTNSCMNTACCPTASCFPCTIFNPPTSLCM